MKKVAICILAFALVVIMTAFDAKAQTTNPSESWGYSTMSDDYHWGDPTGEAILFDVLLLRPLGIAASAVGLAGSFISMPFTASSNSQDVVSRKLLVEPFEYTWRRPLGDVDGF